MSIIDQDLVMSSDVAPINGVFTLPTDAIPMPLDIGELTGGSRLRMVAGTEADDRLELSGGAAYGAGGNDTFVLTSTQSDLDEPEHLGVILDFSTGDTLDLSKLGDKATILGQQANEGGGQRVSIDYDGDGKEDGFVILHENGAPAPDDSGVVTGPADEGEFTILPFPMPGDDGVVTILPYPMPGDGEVTAFTSDFTALTPAELQSVSLDWIL